MSKETLIRQLGDNPGDIRFDQVIECITRHYDYTPTAFTNGAGGHRIVNRAGENEGSCKIFAFGRLNGLTDEQTLACFGEHYRHVLETPDGNDHANIRTFMRFGQAGIDFEGTALIPRITPGQ